MRLSLVFVLCLAGPALAAAPRVKPLPVVLTHTLTVTGEVKATITHTITVTGAVEATLTHTVSVTGGVNATLERGFAEIGKSDVWRLPPGERTNVLPYSDQLIAGNWKSNAVTVVVNADRNPDGRTVSEEVRQDNTVDFHGIWQDAAFTPAVGQRVCVSYDVKDNGQGWVGLTLHESEDYGLGQYFEISRGLVGNAIGDTTSSMYVATGSQRIFAVGNDYWRCQFCVDIEGASGGKNWGTGMVLARQTDNDSYTAPWDITFAGDSTSGVYVTNVQVEVGVPFPGPHVRTEASAATSGTNYQITVRQEPGAEIDAPRYEISPGQASTSSGVFLGGLIAQRFDTLTTIGTGTGQKFPLNMDSLGRIWSRISAVDFSVSTQGAVLGDITGGGKMVAMSMTTDGAGRNAPVVIPTGMRVSVSQYEVPVDNVAAVNLFPNALPGATHVEIQNLGTSPIYLGNAGVSVAAPLGTNGIRVPANGGAQMYDSVSEGFQIWAIGTKAAAEDVRVMRY